MHTPVLLHEVIDILNLQKGETVVDATVGDGGHAKSLCVKLGPRGKIVGIDLDDVALEQAKKALAECLCTAQVVRGNFRDIEKILVDIGIVSADKILFDLGLRTAQIEQSGRGFSFRKDEPLLMTFDANVRPDTITAAHIVNTYKKENIARILKDYGEERFAQRIANCIVMERKKKRITHTTDLVRVIEQSIPARLQKGRLHFATKTFQALRIAVNDELGALKVALDGARAKLAPGGRIVVITFHSLEDRIVKTTFREWEQEGMFRRLTKKPIIPKEDERQRNPKSRSAKLRAIQYV